MDWRSGDGLQRAADELAKAVIRRRCELIEWAIQAWRLGVAASPVIDAAPGDRLRVLRLQVERAEPRGTRAEVAEIRRLRASLRGSYERVPCSRCAGARHVCRACSAPGHAGRCEVERCEGRMRPCGACGGGGWQGAQGDPLDLPISLTGR